jgi:predicted esterase
MTPLDITRRSFLALTAAAVAVPVLQRRNTGDGHLSAKFKQPTNAITPGEHALGFGGARDGLLVVPKGYRPEEPAPLAVMLHGAGGAARRTASLFSVADELGVIVLAPESRDRTWDAIRGEFGPDIEFLNRALDHTFARCAINRRQLAIGGFSDGASYGLSVGVASGDLFTHVLACSPGFVIPGPLRGRPKIYISHGKADQILPIDVTSRRLVPDLQNAGYQVKYHEFEGRHGVPTDIAREAFTWFIGR